MRALALAVLVAPLIQATGYAQPLISNVTATAEARYEYSEVTSLPYQTGVDQGIGSAQISAGNANGAVSASAAIEATATLNHIGNQVNYSGSGTASARAPHGPLGPHALGQGSMTIGMDVTLTETSQFLFSTRVVEVVSPGGPFLSTQQTWVRWGANLYGIAGPYRNWSWGIPLANLLGGAEDPFFFPNRFAPGVYHLDLSFRLLSFADYEATMPSSSSLTFEGHVLVIPVPEPAAVHWTSLAAMWVTARRRRANSDNHFREKESRLLTLFLG